MQLSSNASGITNFRVEDAPVEKADPTIAPEDVVESDPAAGDWIDAEDEVVVRRNPPPPIDTPSDDSRDPRCETAERGDTGPHDMFELVTEEPPYWTAVDPDTSAELSIPLHYGDPYPRDDGEGGWGFRHIRYEHGWDDLVAGRTAAALMGERSPSGGDAGGRWETDGSLTYWQQFVHPETGERCTQIVRARPEPKPGFSETLGILTSYARFGWIVPAPR